MKKRLIAVLSVLFWLALWQVGSMLLDQKLLLVSPLETAARFFELVPSAEFWRSVGFSAVRVMLGFALGLSSGVLLAALAGKVRFVKLLSPLVSAVKAVPVASMTLLALVWVSSRNLSVLVSFLIALPIVYSNMLEGIENLDPKLKEMAELFRIPAGKRFAGIYLSQLLPYFRSASRLAIGLSWKSGAAAEIIGIPTGSIGEKLYEAKIYLETADMFAWTITVVLLSWLSEKLFLLLVNEAAKLVSGGGLFRLRERVVPGRKCAPAGISVRGLGKSYGENSVLGGFSYEFPAGEITAVMGASGCGKTTLISLLTGLLKPDIGSVELTPGDTAFSAVFQEDRLCENLTVTANIRLVCGNHRSSSEIAQTLDALGLSGWGDKPVRELSGGMKRRAALARALLADYGVIVLDEPFKGLDEGTKAQVVEHCREMLAGKTVILVTHDSEECQLLADNVVML